jgi:hypothetical protein
MAVESKIRELLTKTTDVELVEETTQELDEMQKLAPNAGPGDSSSPAQGSSDANPEMEDLSGTGDGKGGLTSPIGKAASAKASKDTTLPAGNGAGDAPNFETKGGKASGLAAEAVESDDEEEVIDEDEDEVEEEAIVEEEILEDEEAEETLFENDIANLFQDEEHLTEEFKTKAASLFEAVVTARVASEVDEIQVELAEEARIAQETFMEETVEKIDGYLNYVAENWMKENELAIERGLRTEITEDFILGMKTLFAEHYIEVPAEKYDVLGEMQAEIDSLKTKLDESIEDKMSLVSEKQELLRAKVIAESTTDLTVTEAEKFTKLIEDVAFDGSDLFAEKVAVIKENYFPKVKATEEDKMSDLVEGTLVDETSPVSIYAQAISKSLKK